MNITNFTIRIDLTLNHKIVINSNHKSMAFDLHGAFKFMTKKALLELQVINVDEDMHGKVENIEGNRGFCLFFGYRGALGERKKNPSHLMCRPLACCKMLCYVQTYSDVTQDKSAATPV